MMIIVVSSLLFWATLYMYVYCYGEVISLLKQHVWPIGYPSPCVSQ